MKQDGDAMRLAMKTMLVRVVLVVMMYAMRLAVVMEDVSAVQVQPLTCTSSASTCPAILYVSNSTDMSSKDVAHTFNATSDRSVLSYSDDGGFLVVVQCSCLQIPSPNIQAYFASTTYTLAATDAGHGIYQISMDHFAGIAWSGSAGQIPITGRPLQIYLACGCAPPSGEFISVITYVVEAGDTATHIAAKFQSSTDGIALINNMTNIDSIQVGSILFLPSTMAASSIVNSMVVPETQTNIKSGKRTVGLFVGLAVSAVVLLAFILIIIVYFIKKDRHGKKKDAKRYSWNPFKQPSSGGIKPSFSLSSADTKGIFIETEKPIVFMYSEIEYATANFSYSKMVGEGAFGAVYHCCLRNQEVAIKKMKASKSREFMAELKVLCKVHHANLVELIGYAIGEEELYLVYEFAEHGSLSDRLQDPMRKGYRPLSWTDRVQIALDVARGLEYLHDHTKVHYIHRDIKSSNILLDGNFRAKVGDFGLAKLVEHANGEGEVITTRVVGTVGYLAPEYLRDGQVTSKNDVYAFGVLLMELVTGLEALSKSKNNENFKLSDRSLVGLLHKLTYKGSLDYEMLESYVDPNLHESYPTEQACKMAEVARVCVEEDSMVRPDMRDIVIKLSHILVSSIEWEASLAGNSQVFTGIVGR